VKRENKNKVPLSTILTLRVNQEKKSYIEFIQENLIENLVQDYLPYILKVHGLYPTTLAYSK